MGFGLFELRVGTIDNGPPRLCKKTYRTAHHRGERFRNANSSEIASGLNVQTVLMGSYVKEGSDLRLTVELIDAGENRIIWQDAFDCLTKSSRPYRSVLQTMSFAD
jgi:hypothetical protein